MVDANENLSVMVIGGGPGGRLMAQGLRKVGIRCTVFEQDDSLDQRSRDWDFGIYWAQTPLDECLLDDVRDKIITAQVDNIQPSADDFLPVYNGLTSEIIHTIPTPHYIRLRRREFARVLGNEIDIRYGKRIAHIDTTSGPGVTATFEDGTTHTASILIGADGAHSYVRENLLGPERGELLYSPVVLSMTISKLPVEKAKQLLKIHQRTCLLFHPNGTFLWIGVHNAYNKPDMADWDFMFISSWKQTEPVNFKGSKDIISDIKARAQAFSEPFRGLVDSINDECKAWGNHLPYWPTQGWDGHPARGKVTLTGDAAHPMTPHRGQGLNNAILDCCDFVKEIEAIQPGERTIAALRAAVVRYEEKMWVRGNDAVLSSLENSMAVHDWETLMQAPVIKDGVNKPKVARMQERREVECKENKNV